MRLTHTLIVPLVLLACSATTVAQDRTVELLRLLADTAGAPGFEEPIRKVMVDQMKPFASSITFDGLGSIIATQGTTGPRIMVDAHMDELGGLVRRITPKGLLTMQMLGGWLDQALVDQRWTIIGSKGPVTAVTGIRDIHVVPAEERTRVYSRNSLYLDVGATSEAEVRAMGISVGDPIVPDAPFEVLNGTGNYLGKAWDDRVGCGVVVEAMRRLATAPHPNQILWTITTQEEIGLRGARTAAETIKPE
ncbi:MAG: M42 family peptidase, partial [Acidobacteriota bacterium]|nr:M42 family peptidase [Acidobacteriota bacterium]